MKKIRKAIFPVAGFGTRFLPVTKTQPKEMLPVVDKPVIHYLVEEAVESGIEEIILVTGRGKRAIEDYFDKSFELEHTLVERGKHDLLKEVLDIPDLARFVYVRQPIPKGDGHAILQAAELVRDEPFAVMFGDDLVMGDKPALRQLIDEYEVSGSSVIAVTEVPDEDLSKYGVVSLDEEMSESGVASLNGFVEKPASKSQAPSNFGVIGKYVVTPEVLEKLIEIEKVFERDERDGEIRLADAFSLALDGGVDLKAKLVKGDRFDTGSKIGMLKAAVEVALSRDDLKDEFRVFLEEKLS
jgi:UTP--glucose-1-phosphate uridylyltransferase